MRARYAYAAAAAAALTIGAHGRSAHAQAPCARPNIPATTTYAALPQAPPLAQQQGISGVVLVIVSLDTQSRVVGTRIQSSPSPILNASALAAARQSTFQTEVRDCKPIAADYVFSVEFVNGTPRVTTNAAGVPSITITGEGIVSRPPDVAFIEAMIISEGDDGAAAAANNDATIAALVAKLRALGIDPEQMRSSVPLGLGYTPAPGVRGGAARRLSIRVDNLSDLAKVTEAVTAAGTRTPVRSVQYGLKDGARAYDEAVAKAITDARAQAENAAAGEHLHVASIARVVVDQRRQPLVISSRSVAPDARPGPVEVRATVTVTFLLKP